MSCGVVGRRGLDLVLLWLWCRLPAVARNQPLAWELQYAVDVALKRKKRFHPGIASLETQEIPRMQPCPPSQTIMRGTAWVTWAVVGVGSLGESDLQLCRKPRPRQIRKSKKTKTKQDLDQEQEDLAQDRLERAEGTAWAKAP